MGAEFYNSNIRPADLKTGYRNFNQPDNPTIRTLNQWVDEGDVLLPIRYIRGYYPPLMEKIEPWSGDGSIRTSATGELKSNEPNLVRGTRNAAHAIFQSVYYIGPLDPLIHLHFHRGDAATRPLRDGNPLTEPPVGIELWVSASLHNHVAHYEYHMNGKPTTYVMRLPGEEFEFVPEGFAAYADHSVRVKDIVPVNSTMLGEEASRAYSDPITDPQIREHYRTHGIRRRDIERVDTHGERVIFSRYVSYNDIIRERHVKYYSYDVDGQY